MLVTSPIPPSVNHYTKTRVVYAHGKHMPVVYKTKEAKDYEKKFGEIIRQQAKLQNWNWVPNTTQHFYVDAVFYFDRIDKDPGNYDKCLLDTITDTQLVWIDDNVALFRPLRVYYDNVNPRIELRIYPVNYVGIFDNQSQLNEFENRCIGCSKYKRNCSILKKAKEGRIQTDIENMVCKKYKEMK